MKNINKGIRKHNHILLALFIIGVILSVIGYILRGTASTPADHTTEGIGALIGGLSGLVLFIWFCLVILSLLNKNK